ncbi:LuxR family transcriptional regulator [Acidocella facilis]|uniref:LuxR family transcriptional regulator n=1 Tax=Acidocella facilis TaxID=525 RepID=UPI001FD043DB|nr:LuxR family transcriptional regulator [Acidocella facilis]
MKNFPVIRIWEGCDPTVAEAIRQFQDRWRPYSGASRGKRIDRLIQELIDPAVARYAASLPQQYLSYMPGAGGVVTLSDIVRLVGLNSMARLQRQLLRAFVSTQAEETARDQRFVATLETLLDLIRACARKPPLKAKVRDTRLNGRRAQEFCRLCGAPAELTAFAVGNDNTKRDDPGDVLRLSSVYCTDHRPQLPNGDWNPAYRKAKRSLAQFDMELARLTKQSGNWKKVEAQSGDPLVDSYIYHFIRKHHLRPGDEAELRDHARRMADGKLSDRKKQMVMLERYGVSQSDAARRLGVERQAVSKALAALPSEFRQLPNLLGFPAYFLVSTKEAN